jgi:hypothetical protein
MDDLLRFFSRSQDIVLLGEARPKPVTLWLPFFNGEEFVHDRIREALNQEFSDYALIICDNSSTDNTWSVIQSLQYDLPQGTLLLRNPFNVGFSGSIAFNKDLIKSDWITFMHQDDSYLSHHLQTLMNESLRSSNEVVAISTEMGRLDPVKNIVQVTPRATMYPFTDDQVGHFIRNLTTQSIPWPSTLFRVTPYLHTLAPWHSEAFGDVEQSLALLLIGKHVTVPLTTMGYRENETSASHTTMNSELQRATTLGLLRIFHSDSFMVLAIGLPADQREIFYKKLRSSVLYRMESMSTKELVLDALDEQLNFAWKYSVPTVLTSLQNVLKDIHATRPQGIIDSLIHIHSMNSSDLGQFRSKTREETLASMFVKNPQASLLSRAIRRVLHTLEFFFPKSMVRHALRLLIRLRVRLDKGHHWDFRWR